MIIKNLLAQGVKKMKSRFLNASLVALAVALSANSLGCTASAEAAPPTQPTTSSSQPAQTAQTVQFADATDLPALAKTYPFLADTLQEIVSSNTDAAVPDTVRVATLNTPDKKSDLLFVSFNGPNYCGSGGCMTDVYINSGNGYMKAIGISAVEPVYLTKTADSTLNISFCAKEGRQEYAIRDGKIGQYKQIVTPKTMTPACGAQ